MRVVPHFLPTLSLLPLFPLFFPLKNKFYRFFFYFLAKSRKSSTDTFLSRLNSLKISCSSVSCLFSQKLSSLPSLHFQCHERIFEIFDKIERILNFEKTSIFVENRFLLEKRRIILENRIKELRDIGGEVEKWESDIIQNYEKIVGKIEMTPFKEIMGRYEEKINGFEEKLRNAKNDLKLNFDDFLTTSENGIEKIEAILKGIFTFKNEKVAFEEAPNNKPSKESIKNKETKNYENKENINCTLENKSTSEPPSIMNKALFALINKNKNSKKSNEGLVNASLKNMGRGTLKSITNLNVMKKN